MTMHRYMKPTNIEQVVGLVGFCGEYYKLFK